MQQPLIGIVYRKTIKEGLKRDFKCQAVQNPNLFSGPKIEPGHYRS